MLRSSIVAGQKSPQLRHQILRVVALHGMAGARDRDLPAMRHRVILNFEAQAENLATDALLIKILAEVKEKALEGK